MIELSVDTSSLPGTKVYEERKHYTQALKITHGSDLVSAADFIGKYGRFRVKIEDIESSPRLKFTKRNSADVVWSEAQIGDYIVISDTGAVYVMDSWAFEYEFQEVKNSDEG